MDQSPVWVTAEAVMALAEKPLPLAPVPPRATTTARPARHATTKPHLRATPRPRRKLRRRPETAPPVQPSRLSMTLAADAGILDALALAPIGIG
jgi:hypothetical protein